MAFSGEGENVNKISMSRTVERGGTRARFLKEIENKTSRMR